MKQNVKTVLVWLAFPINARQNANQKPIENTPAYRVKCTLLPHRIYRPSFRFFESLVPRPLFRYVSYILSLRIFHSCRLATLQSYAF